MATYLDRYLAGEYNAVWSELTALGPAIRDEPLFADAQAVAHETMARARMNVETLIQRLTALGYHFISDALGEPPTPFLSPTQASLAEMRDLERTYGNLPLSVRNCFES